MSPLHEKSRTAQGFRQLDLDARGFAALDEL
jgi:hypothetical protein